MNAQATSSMIGSSAHNRENTKLHPDNADATSNITAAAAAAAAAVVMNGKKPYHLLLPPVRRPH